MKKIKRILALIGAILLFLMYAATLIFALIGSEQAFVWLKISIACTIMVPIMLYGYILAWRAFKKDDSQTPQSEDDV